MLARITARHRDADDLVGSDGIDRDRGHNTGIDAAGQADERRGETRLRHVIASAQNQRMPNFRFVAKERRPGRVLWLALWEDERAGVIGNVHACDTAQAVAIAQFDPAACVVQAALGDSVEVYLGDEKALLELSATGKKLA